MTSLVIIPTFNEKENIENIIRAVFALNEVFHVLVVDDGSPDGTAAIVKELQSEFYRPTSCFRKRRQTRPWHCIHLWISNGG